MSSALIPQEQNLPVKQDQPASLLSVIAQAVADPRMDVEKMRQLFELQKDILAEERRVAFFAALSRLQAKLPHIDKDGRIVVKGVERSRYSKIETIDRAIRGLLTEEGFAFSFDTESNDGKLFRISCKLSHREGHTETKSLMLPMDVSDFRSNVQSIGSTVSYGRRQLIKMHLNLIEENEDNDGNNLAPISEDEARDLETQIQGTKSSLDGFLNYMGVESLRDIRKKDLAKAQTALQQKRRGR